MRDACSSATLRGFATSLAIHLAGLGMFYVLSERVVAPILLSAAYGSRAQQALEVSWAADGMAETEPEEVVTVAAPAVEVEAAANVERRENESAGVALAWPVEIADAALAPVEFVDTSVVPHPSSAAEVAPAVASSQPRRRASSSAAAMPAVAAVPMPSAPFRFVGRACRYPESALAAGWEGTVVLLVHLNSDGMVTRVEIETSSGFPPADDEALRTVQTWRAVSISPGEQLTTLVVRQPVQFTLRGA
jgi:TonB family protein